MRNKRILIIDDNPAIHVDMRKILCPTVSAESLALDSLEAELLGVPATASTSPANFELDSAMQGEEGLAMLRQSLIAERPYAMAFVDMRMPPGWDGLVTTLALWEAEPELQVVICTAYSDYSWDEMLSKLGSSDRLLILKKPFDTVEVLQLANALTEKWDLLNEIKNHSAMLEERVRDRTAQLEQVNSNLRSEIDHRIQIEKQLVEAKDAAEAATRVKADFLANMSHEIRTPMNGVIGLATILLDSRLDDDQTELVNMMIGSGKNLLELINDIMDLSKMESRQLQLEDIEFNIYEQLHEVVALHAVVADQKGLELILDVDDAIPQTLRGDPVRLRQIIFNLVGNATKFTLRGEIVLSIKLESESPNSVTLRIDCKDTGIGIAATVQATLFQPFVQADSSTTRKYGGTGLGLAICRDLVELMNGDIGVMSKLNEGSTFWCTCQLRKAQSANRINSGATPLQAQRILIVVGNTSSRELLEKMIRKWGAEVVGVGTEAAAKQEWHRSLQEHKPYTTLLLDHHLQDGNGLALVRSIQSSNCVPMPGFVLLTTRAGKLSAELINDAHVEAIEIKPVTRDKLCRALLKADLKRAAVTGSAPRRIAN
jgi:signal transduction histidine kinase